MNSNPIGIFGSGIGGLMDTSEIAAKALEKYLSDNQMDDNDTSRK